MNKSTFLIAFSLFLTGASSLVVEYVLATTSSYVIGNSVVQFSLTIAVMLGMMGVGSYLQRFLSDKNIIEKFIGIEVALALFGGFSPIAVYFIFGHTPESVEIFYYFFVVMIGLLVGFEIPIFTRINEQYSSGLKDNLAIILLADYIGGLVGAVAWVYLLLPVLPLVQIGFVIAGINFVVAVITFIHFKGFKAMFSWIGLMLVSVIVALVFGYTQAVDWSLKAEQKMYEDPIQASQRTKAQYLVVTHDPATNDTRLYINGNTQMSSTDEKKYHEFLVHPIMGMGKHDSVLVLGGGDGLAIRELKKYDTIKNLTLIDIDKGMIDFAKHNTLLNKLNENAFSDFEEREMFKVEQVVDYFQSKARKGRQVVYTDAGTFVNGSVFARQRGAKNTTYDVVIIDLPDPSSLEVNKLYTEQFYRRIQKLLSKDGRIVVQSTSPYHAKEAYLMIGRTLAKTGLETIPFHANIPSFGEWGWWVSVPKGTSVSEIKLIDEVNHITPESWKASMVFGKGELEAVNQEVNSLINPVLMRIYNEYSWKLY